MWSASCTPLPASSTCARGETDGAVAIRLSPRSEIAELKAAWSMELLCQVGPLDPRQQTVSLQRRSRRLCASDRDRGAPHDAAPPTPPGIRVTYLGGSIGLSFSMQPGFRVLSSSGPVRPFGRNPFLRCQSYSPAPNRSGLRQSFPARPICCSAFRTGVPH